MCMCVCVMFAYGVDLLLVTSSKEGRREGMEGVMLAIDLRSQGSWCWIMQLLQIKPRFWPNNCNPMSVLFPIS